MIKAGIIGATGYAGAELVRILMGHKEVEIKWYGSRSYIDQKYASVYQNMFQSVDAVCIYQFKKIAVNIRIMLVNVTSAAVPLDLHFFMIH